MKRTCDYCDKPANQLAKTRTHGHICRSCYTYIHRRGWRATPQLRRIENEVDSVMSVVNAEHTDFDGVAAACESVLEGYRAGYDYKYATPAHLTERAGDKLDYIAQTIERKRAESDAGIRTREEWEKLEEEYATEHVPSYLSWEDVEADLLVINKTKEEWEKLSESEKESLQQEAYERYLDNIIYYQECAYVLCEGIFDTRRGRSDRLYCSRECKKAQEHALSRFAEKGTYLPETAYIPKRSDSVEESHQKYEIPFSAEMVVEIGARREERVHEPERDRESEYYVTRRKDVGNPEYDAFVRGEIEGVKFLNFGGKVYKNREIAAPKPYSLWRGMDVPQDAFLYVAV